MTKKNKEKKTEETLVPETNVVAKDVPAPVKEMEEVIFDPSKHSFPKKDVSEDTRVVINKLIGMTKEGAEMLLKPFKDNKDIAEYRLVAHGALTDMNYVSGRVSLFYDKSGKIIRADIE